MSYTPADSFGRQLLFNLVCSLRVSQCSALYVVLVRFCLERFARSRVGAWSFELFCLPMPSCITLKNQKAAFPTWEGGVGTARILVLIEASFLQNVPESLPRRLQTAFVLAAAA